HANAAFEKIVVVIRPQAEAESLEIRDRSRWHKYSVTRDPAGIAGWILPAASRLFLFSGRAVLGRAFGSRQVLESLALARVLAFALVVAGLAVRLALARVDAVTRRLVAFGGGGSRRGGKCRQRKQRGSGGKRQAGVESNHGCLLDI